MEFVGYLSVKKSVILCPGSLESGQGFFDLEQESCSGQILPSDDVFIYPHLE